MGLTCEWCGQELVEVDNPLRREVRHKRGQEGACPGPPVEEFETGPEVDVLRVHGFDGSESTIRVGPAGARLVQRVRPFGNAGDLVLEWDVEDGGHLGAVIVCRSCDGLGRVPEDHGTIGVTVQMRGCPECSGSGVLHRVYQLPEPETPEPDRYDPAPGHYGAPAVILGGPWSGCELKRFAYFLAGALSHAMLPADQVMPTEAIDEVMRRVMTSESARVDDEADQARTDEL